MEGLTINRQGNFSCPVSTGVIFVANLPTPDTPASAFEEAANHFAVRFPLWCLNTTSIAFCPKP